MIMKIRYFRRGRLGAFIGFFALLGFVCSASAQHLRPVIGEYECTSTADCEEGICDIDTHTCRTCPSCPELPECGDKNEVNGKCVECTSNAECTESGRPYCNTATFTCQTCPGDKPFWNGNECEACPAGTTLEGGVCSCPSDKPYRLASCIGCEGNKIFVSEHNACECPSDLPNWNTETKMCVEPCENDWKWKETQCVECLTNADCKEGESPLCNTDNTCTPCPSSRPSWNDELKQCEECSLTRPYWNKAERQCQPCPDGGIYDVEKGTCVITVFQNEWNICPWGPAPGCWSIVDKFGPYTHNYGVYLSGSTDDQMRLYIDSTNMLSTGKTSYNTLCNWYTGYSSAFGNYGGYTARSKLGDLPKGSYGSALLYSSGGCIYFKNGAKIWLELEE